MYLNERVFSNVKFPPKLLTNNSADFFSDIEIAKTG
jgi:hypothetical protein